MSSISSKDLHRIFKKLDRNGDGLVSLDDLMSFLEKMGIHSGLQELESLAGKTSLDPIDFTFFYEILIKRKIGEKRKEGEVDEKKLEYDDLVKVFRVYDLDGDGFISSEELQTVLLRLGLGDEHCGEDCQSMIRAYDRNSDGVLDFEEFKMMMLHPHF